MKNSQWHVQPKTIFLHRHTKCVRIPPEETDRPRLMYIGPCIIVTVEE